MLGELAGEEARTQQRSMFALIPLASATDAIDAWGSSAIATTRALNSSECLRQLRLCGLPVVGEVGVVYMCPSKVCGHKHPCSAKTVQGEIAGRIRRLNPDIEPLTMAYVLGQVATARADLSVAAFYGGDFRTSSAFSKVIQLRSSELLRRTGLNLNVLQQFQEIVFDDAPSLREVIDGGERSFSELMTLLDNSKLFRYWTNMQSPDSNLTREYFEEAQREGWLESLPAKGLRYLIGQALSAKLPMLGELFSVADSFILEKMAKGWRPSHFVDKRYKPFVS